MIPSYLTHCIQAALYRFRPDDPLSFYERCMGALK